MSCEHHNENNNKKQQNKAKKNKTKKQGNVAFWQFCFPPVPIRVITQVWQSTNYEEFTISRQIVTFSGVCARLYDPTLNETKCYEELNYFLFRKSRREGWARGKWSQRGG